MATTSESDAGTAVPDAEASGWTRIPGFVDWLFPVLLGFLGLALVLSGLALLLLADREAIATMVAEGAIQSDVFADADLTEVTYATVRWTGIGLAVTGILAWVAPVAFASYRRRDRQQASQSGERGDGAFTSAFVGAVVAVVASMLPFATAIGGFVAGYVHRSDPGEAGRVGAFASLLTLVPIVVLLAFVFGGMAVGAARVDALGGALLVASVAVVALLVTVLLAVALGWIGGYLAGVVTRRSRERERVGPDLAPGAPETGSDAGDESATD